MIRADKLRRGDRILRNGRIHTIACTDYLDVDRRKMEVMTEDGSLFFCRWDREFDQPSTRLLLVEPRELTDEEWEVIKDQLGPRNREDK
jgi:hypothetical protein